MDDVLPYRPGQRLDPRLALARERLARLSPGGTPEWPEWVESASQIEVRALGSPCLRCQGPYRFDEHTAERLAGHDVRVVRLHCGHCAAPRVTTFGVAAPE